MSSFEIAALLVVVAAGFSYINVAIFKLPSTIALLLSGLAASAVLALLDRVAPSLTIAGQLQRSITRIDFADFLLGGVLSFLLFAGALHLDFEELRRERVPVLVLASVGVIISTLVLGLGSFLLFHLFHVEISLAYCLVFGAVVSPTDPIAVLGIIKTVGAPKALEVKIAGESLFNDGFAIVLFSVLTSVAAGAAHEVSGSTFEAAALMFLEEAVGGVALGLLLGYLTYQLMKRIDEPNVEVFLSFALVLAISLIAFRVHTSAPLACVVAGLFIGNQGRRFALQEASRQALDLVWSFIDYLLNAILFLLLGLQAILLWPGTGHAILIVPLILLTLLARWCSVLLPSLLLRWRHHSMQPNWITLLVWGGLRGGISVAMALSLPRFTGRDTVLVITYAVVIFSIVVQGLTMPALTRRALRTKTV